MDLDTHDKPFSGVDASKTRAFNRSVVMAKIKSEGPVSRAVIARSTRLAKATVSVIVDELVAYGLVIETGVGSSPSQGGRPPILLEYNARSELLIGIHMGVQHTTVVLATGSGEELARRSALTPRKSPETAITTFAELTAAVLGDVNADLTEVVSIAVCLPGLTDTRRGVCLFAPNLGWRNVPVMSMLAAALGAGTPIRVQNTTQAVALAENLEGAGIGVRDLLLVYLGTGVGAAFIHEGSLVGGATGIAGEIGHCAIPGATRICTCGKVGCLETIASARGIVETVVADLAAGAVSKVKFDGPVTAQAVALAALDGDPVCIRAVESAGRQLGGVLACAVNLLNPSVVIVAGGVADMGDLLLRPLRTAVTEGALADALSDLDIRAAKLGQEAKIRGAVLTALRNWQAAKSLSLGR